MPNGGFDLHFSDNEQCCVSSHVPVHHLCISCLWEHVYFRCSILDWCLFLQSWVYVTVCLFWNVVSLSVCIFLNISPISMCMSFNFLVVSLKSPLKASSLIESHLFIFVLETDLEDFAVICPKMFCLCSLLGILWCHVLYLEYLNHLRVYFHVWCEEFSSFIDLHVVVHLSKHHLLRKYLFSSV